MLKHQVMNLFIISNINSSNMQAFIGVYWLRWCCCLLERLLIKKLIVTKVQVVKKEIYNIAIKDRVLTSKNKEICHD